MKYQLELNGLVSSLVATSVSECLKIILLASCFVTGRTPFAFLEDIHGRFVKTYGRAALTALAYAMNDEFSRVLSQQMDYYSNDPNADRINRMRGEISQVLHLVYFSYPVKFILAFYCLFSFSDLVFIALCPPPPLFRSCFVPVFLAHVVSSLAYCNLLGNKMFGCCEVLNP
jgi:hypothetical protein